MIIPKSNPGLNPQSPEDTNDQQEEQWILIHDMQVVGYYNSYVEAQSAMDGYRMDRVLDINSNLIMRQIL